MTNPLQAYLTDHHGGAAAGAELARKLRSRFDGTDRGPFFDALTAEIEADKATLEALIGRLGFRTNALKESGAWLAEKATRLRLNQWLTGSAELTSLLEIELLALGVEGKLAMWQALREVSAANETLGAESFDELIQRAGTQRDGLERERRRSAREALTTAHSRSGSASAER